MTDAEIINKDVIEIEKDFSVEIGRQSNGIWLISFLDGAGKLQKAPEVDNVKAESIGSDFVVRVLMVTEGKDANTLKASGKTELANYARVSVLRNGEWKVKYALLDKTETPTAPIGPKGGPIMDMGHDSFVELTANPDKPWELTFYEGPTAETTAPDPSIILVEALTDDGRVTKLDVSAGQQQSILVTSKPTEQVSRVRVLWAHGEHYHRREFNLPT